MKQPTAGRLRNLLRMTEKQQFLEAKWLKWVRILSTKKTINFKYLVCFYSCIRNKKSGRFLLRISLIKVVAISLLSDSRACGCY